jgi:glycosyltransferase involved in cell wall biosynthesis
LGYLGRLKEEKGLLTILSALKSLPEYCQATFIGQGPMRDELEAYAARLGLSDRVTIQPGIPSSQVPDTLSRLDVLVLPSLTRPNWKEQFGRTLAEAMSCETPVIGSDSGEIPSVIGDAGLIFKEGDSADLAACVERLVADPVFYADLARRGRQRVLDRYTQGEIARRTYALYGKISGG